MKNMKEARQKALSSLEEARDAVSQMERFAGHCGWTIKEKHNCMETAAALNRWIAVVESVSATPRENKS